jgi:predicted RNA-binding protein with RPS1 domain
VLKTEANIERIIEKGVIVELPEGVDGFVPVSQLSFAPVRNISEYFEIGDALPLKVVEFDKEAKKIVLSVVEALRDKEQEVIDKYNEAHPVPNSEKVSNSDGYKADDADYFDNAVERTKEVPNTIANNIEKEEPKEEAPKEKVKTETEEVATEEAPVAESTDAVVEETPTEEVPESDVTEDKSEEVTDEADEETKED